jgi:uncharacterized membrane protein
MGKVERWGILCGVTTGGGGMERFMQSGLQQLVLSILGLAILVAVAWYVIAKTRPKPIQKEHTSTEWLLKCREMNLKGELSNQEFRTIETTLTSQLQDELNDNGDEG